MLTKVARGVDERLGVARFSRSALRKVFPDHWSFLLGEVAMYAFAVLVATGVFLTFFFQPSSASTVYNGSYAPLHGVTMSRAYESSVHLSFDVRAGLVIRQMHHWAALVFIAAIVAHLCRIFFTAAFRRPREINWIVGLLMLLLAIVNGFAGYSLLDDLLSGTGLRIGYSIVLGVPVIGSWLASLIFGGEFPAPDILSRLYTIHILIIPVTIGALIGVHLAIVWRQKHTQFTGPGRTERNVVGSHLWPTYAAKSVGLFAIVAGVLAGLGGLVQINPVWLYGPYDPAAVTTAAQPDWYMGWLEGASRLAGPWRFSVFGYTVSELFVPTMLLPAVTFGLLFAWPWIEKRITHDTLEHHLLERPRDRPWRTAIGVGVLTFYVVLFVAGSQDVIAQKLNTSIDNVLLTLRILVFVLPLLSAAFAYKLASDLRAADRTPPRSKGISVRAGPVLDDSSSGGTASGSEGDQERDLEPEGTEPVPT